LAISTLSLHDALPILESVRSTGAATYRSRAPTRRSRDTSLPSHGTPARYWLFRHGPARREAPPRPVRRVLRDRTRGAAPQRRERDRKSTRLNSSHRTI